MDEHLQTSGLQTPHFVGAVLDERARWIGAGGRGGRGGRGGDGDAVQRDPVNGTVLRFFTPLLHWVLRIGAFCEISLTATDSCNLIENNNRLRSHKHTQFCYDNTTF